MSDYTIVLEFGAPCQFKPGLHRDKDNFRAWCLFFAVSFYKISFANIIRGANKGSVVWK